MKNILRSIVTMKLASAPKDLIFMSLMIAALYVACQCCGLRSYTSFICGTSEIDGNMALSALLGAIYIIIHMLFTVAAPILLIMAVLLKAFGRLK